MALGDVEGVLLSDDVGVVSVPDVVLVSVADVVVLSVAAGVAVSDGEAVSDGVAVSVVEVVDDVELVELVLESVDESLDELTTGVGEPGAPAALPEDVRTVDDAGGDPQSELCAFAAGAWMAKAPNAMSATPRSPSPTAIPSAAGLSSSALTVQPRIS